MRKLFAACAAALTLFTAVPSAVLAAPQTATVRGSAPGKNLAAATEDARHDAVYKTLAHTIRLENIPPEAVAEIMENYNLYVTKVEILQKKAEEAGSFVIARITVDADLLNSDLRRIVDRKQSNNHLMKACFLVRTTGAELANAENIVLTTCSSNYQDLGFETKTNDSFLTARRPGMQALAGESLAVFEQDMLNKLYNEWLEYQFALIGEVAVTTKLSDATGVTKTAHVRVKAIDVGRQCFIGELDEDYDYRAATAAEAERLVLQKAAVDFSEVLGGQTLRYWQGKK